MWIPNSKFFLYLKDVIMLGTVAQACNPSYLGGRDPEDQDSGSVWTKNS
jgi:hypothetical protein